LRAESGFLDRVKLLEILPGLVPDRAGDIDSESYGGHDEYFNRWRMFCDVGCLPTRSVGQKLLIATIAKKRREGREKMR
jgi:hypothetical protein